MKKTAIRALTAVMVISCAALPGYPISAQAQDSSAPEISTKKKGKALNLYLKSIIEMRRGRYQEGIQSMRGAADIDSNSRPLQLRLLAVYFRDGDYKNAATMAERAIKSEPESVILHIWLGRIYAQLGRVDESVELFQKAIALDPENNEAYESLAEVEEDSNDLVGAIATYEAMLKQTPDSAFLYYRLGINLMDLGDSPASRDALIKALELDEKLAPARYILGVVYMDLEDWPSALQAFERYLEDNPTHAPCRENIAAIHAHLEHYDTAFEILTNLIEGKDVSVQHHLQRTYTYLRHPAAAESYISAAPNDAPILGTVFQILVKRDAGEPYKPIVKNLDSIDGDLDFECSAYLGSLLTRYGTKEAGGFIAAQITSLVDDAPKSKVLLTVLGRTLMYTDRYDDARDAFQDIIKIFGPDKLTHYYLATAFESLDDAENAELHLRKTLEFDQNDPDVLNFLGYLLAEEDEKLKEAEEMIERALANDPDNGFYTDSLGWVYYRQGKGKKAVEYIKRAIRLMSSDDAVLRDHLGDAYLLIRRVDNAIAEWERAHRLDPDLEGVKEKIDKHSKGKRKRNGT